MSDGGVSAAQKKHDPKLEDHKLMSSSPGEQGYPYSGVIEQPIRLDDLPPPDTKRWVSRRKAKVVAAVRQGLLTLEDACRRYNLSMEEFLSWQRLIERHGVPGLRATRLQDYRGAEEAQARPQLTATDTD
jgi:hypothetical protein